MLTFIKIFHITHRHKLHKIHVVNAIKISSNEDLAVFLNKISVFEVSL